MSGPILHNSAPILLIGAGPASIKQVTKAFLHAESIVALDGGLKTAQAAGLPVDLIVGDLDSVDPAQIGSTQVQHIQGQDNTDLEKALALVAAPVILAVGVLGGRLDHQLATFSALLKDPRPIIAIDETYCVFVASSERPLELGIPKGSQVAFYPMRPVHATIAGTKWPVQGQQLAPDGMISTSNEMAGGQLLVRVDQRGLLVMLPVASLVDVISAIA